MFVELKRFSTYSCNIFKLDHKVFVMTNDNYTITRSVVFAIRDYVSSQNIMLGKSVNRIFQVETALNNFKRMHKNVHICDDLLRQRLCSEAIRFGMILYFGKVD